MKMYLSAIKSRLLPLIGWLVGSFFFMFIGWLIGAAIGYLCEAVGIVNYSNQGLEGLAFLQFPFYGGIVSLIVMHILRSFCWRKLHSKYIKENNGWNIKHTIGIVLFDELLWIMLFVGICFVLIKIL